MSRREEGKADRRRRIVIAARELIRETGGAGLSMRAIAARANVSLATPYNLFGSKRAIVLAVLEDVREFGERFASVRNASAIDRIFKALQITLSYHADDPDFYRTLWASILDTSGSASATELRTEILTPQSVLFWRTLVLEAARDGVFAEDADLDVMLMTVNLQFGAVMLNWVMGSLTTEMLEPAVGYGYAVAFTACASEEHRPKLWKRAQDYQKRLVKLTKQATAAA